MKNHRLTLALATAVAGLALLTTGCSGSDGGGEKASGSSGGAGGSDSGDATDKAQKLRVCLREKGMDVPDLEPGANPYAQALGAPEGVSPEKWHKALEDCGSGTGPGDGGEDARQDQDQDQQVRIAECVRGKGFDMPDPKVGPDGSRSGFKIPEGADPEKFVKALNECAA
ncbi:hypothetical protein [Streptomyces sp. ITFR-16]|uniref:hypothetical protein n=1 Tax=Streptomyces sp. ITFR-16 TaxID=3075198 RepID=UPI00288AC90E|nr:hypothetical protein [Streptomyces sp. ITFR-16]WNI21290.1 hypothetical protein RLT58_04820 [Streptomyces sp. ITFR-16]